MRSVEKDHGGIYPQDQSAADNRSARLVSNAVHYNSPSILLEDKAWLAAIAALKVDIVDPEIGSFALAALASNVHFGYLHLVSNSLSAASNYDLGNERQGDSPVKRKNLHVQIARTVEKVCRELVSAAPRNGAGLQSDETTNGAGNASRTLEF